MGDKLVSVRYGDSPADDHFLFELSRGMLPQGGLKIRNVGSGTLVHWDGDGDKLLSGRFPSCNDAFTTFVFEPVPSLACELYFAEVARHAERLGDPPLMDGQYLCALVRTCVQAQVSERSTIACMRVQV
jgi:hypothetical protein